MDRYKSTILKVIQEWIRELKDRGIDIEIDIGHGIQLKVDKAYLQDLVAVVEEMMKEDIIYGYYIMRYSYADIVTIKVVYTR